MTKEECQKQIDQRGNVCSRCGRKPVPINTVDNAGTPTFWIGCFHGGDEGNFDAGVQKEIYDLAVKCVLDGMTCNSYYDKYEYKKSDSLKEYWFMQQVSSMCWQILQIKYLENHEPKNTKEQFFADF